MTTRRTELSPSSVLILLVAYLLGKAIQPQVGLPSLLTKNTDGLLFRGVIFSIFPVLMAVNLLRHQRKQIDQATLRPLFYGQCFICAPFAVAASIAVLLVEFKTPKPVIAGLLVFLIAFCWYVGVEVVWFASVLNVTKVRAAWNVLIVVFMANVLVFLAGLGIEYASKHASSSFGSS